MSAVNDGGPMKPRFLCRIGFHRRREAGIQSILWPMPVEQCECCGIGQSFNMGGGLDQYSAEEMNQAKRAFAARQSPTATDRKGEEL